MHWFLEGIAGLPFSFHLTFFFVIGSFFGSFSNVLIYRMSEDKPLNLWGRSYCPHCECTIPFYLNIPIFSWFFLLGRCRSCKEKISFQYPLVEFLMASLFAGFFILMGWKWFLLEVLIFTFGLITVSFIDLKTMILPDSFTLSGGVIGLLGAALNPEREFMASLLGLFLGVFVLWFSAYVYFLVRKKDGMGGGDLKLLGWVGAVLGWKAISFVVVSSCLLGTVVGVGIMLRSKKSLDTAIPFGPYLAIGALCYIFLYTLQPSYLKFFGFF